MLLLILLKKLFTHFSINKQQISLNNIFKIMDYISGDKLANNHLTSIKSQISAFNQNI
jgi:hypothetical protein